MADFDLTQTGQEVQNILNGAAMQTDLTAETERAEQAEQTLQGNIDAEETRAKAAEKQNADDIDVIESKIPAGASDQNQLADKDFVNNSIATATATFRGAYNLVNDLSLTVGATHEQIATALAGAIGTADNNDYCFVQIPTADAMPTQIASIERYKFNGTAWSYEYTLNNSGFTADQWAALNSGITSGLVAKLLALPTNEALALALAGKQDVLTFDSVPVDGSNNPVKSGGVYSAIGDEETRAKAAEKANADDIDDIEALIPAAASDENQLADKEYVNSSISTATATYRGSFNEVNDLSLNTDATHEQIATALAGTISTADNNDYCFVQIPTADATPTQIASIERYKFNGTAWAYEYTLNNSGFTAAQWAALNSGITSGLVAKLSALPTNDALTLALAGKQDVLTFDNEPTSGSNNPVKSGGVYSAIDAEATTRAAAIAAIVALIPEAASALNQLADKAFVNSSISTATAVFKGTYNVVVDLELSYNATQEQIATMLASKIISADNNDYCFVQIPTSDAAPLQIARTDRYKFNGTAWAYEYTLNNSGFTTAQWAAINSGITSLLKDKLIDLPTATELTALLAAKQNQLTFDTTPTTGSTNPVTSGGIKSAIDAEKARAEAAEADRYTKSETYNKTEINGMVSTPHQNYVTVPTYASLPSSGQSTDTIYRVSSYDGANNQVDDTVYSEYAWDGTQYVFLRVNSQIEEVFDITVYNNNTKYADLSAALGVDGANIPATLRRGGMSVKFVQSSDNKYVQYRLTSDNFNITPANWQKLGAEVSVSSNTQEHSSDILINNIKVAEVANSDILNRIIATNVLNTADEDYSTGIIGADGSLETLYTGYTTTGYIPCKRGDVFRQAGRTTGVQVWICYYNSSKVPLVSHYLNRTTITLPVAESPNVAYMRVSMATSALSNNPCIYNSGELINKYVSYGETILYNKTAEFGSLVVDGIDVVDVVDSLRNDLEEKVDAIKNVLNTNDADYIPNRVLYTDGTLNPTEYNQFFTSGFIPCHANDIFRWAKRDKNFERWVCCYNKDKIFVNGSYNYGSDYNIIIPNNSNITYFRFSSKKTIANEAEQCLYDTNTIIPYAIPYGDDRVVNEYGSHNERIAAEQINNIHFLKNVLNTSDSNYADAKIIMADGNLNSEVYNGFATTGFISCKANDRFVFANRESNIEYWGCYFDKNKNALESLYQHDHTGTNYIEVPNDAEIAYMRFSFNKGQLSSNCVYKYGIPIKTIVDYNKELLLGEKAEFNTVRAETIKANTILKNDSPLGEECRWELACGDIICIGDSLTDGLYVPNSQGQFVQGLIEQNYPFYLGRLLNCNVFNAGKNGSFPSKFYNEWYPSLDFKDYDSVFIWLGTNGGLNTADSSAETYSSEKEGYYYTQIIEGIIAQNPTIKITLGKVFVVGYISHSVEHASLETTNSFIDSIAATYNLQVIDLSDLSASARPDLRNNINDTHFAKAGYLYIANRIMYEWRNWFEANHLRCEFGLTTKEAHNP